MARRLFACALLALLAACTAPIRQYDITNQPLTCAEGNDDAYRTLQAMGFTLTGFDPATPSRAGVMHATRQDRGATQSVTVRITCHGQAVDIDASEDGRILGAIDFKRAFYLAFSGTASQQAIRAAGARAEAERPLEEKHQKGLQVLVQPVRGLASKLDFNLDLAAVGILPVQISITNATPRNYKLDTADIVVVRRDGARVPPLSLASAASQAAAAPAGGGSEAAAPSAAEIRERLQSHLLASRSIAPNESVQGYLYFPLAEYVKSRVTLEDTQSEESEGFVVEF